MSEDDDFRGRVIEMLESAPDLESVVMQAIGTASICWSEMPTGIFDSAKAEIVGREVLKYIDENFTPCYAKTAKVD